MRDYGTFFRRERLQHGMRQCDLAEGLCAVDTISRIETGNQTPSAALFALLTERLGVSGFSYGDFFGSSTTRLMYLQRKIVDLLDKKFLDDMPFFLGEFRDTMERSGWDEQFFIFARGWYFFLVTKNAAEFLDCCEKAMQVLHDGFKLGDDVSHSYLIQNEFRILNSAAVAYFLRNEPTKAITLLNQLIINQSQEAYDILASYRRNMAVLCNNAAICEKECYPENAARHIRMAQKEVLISGNPFMNLQVMKTKALKFDEKEEDCSNRKNLEMLYKLVNDVQHIYNDFWDFLTDSCFMQILW